MTINHQSLQAVGPNGPGIARTAENLIRASGAVCTHFDVSASHTGATASARVSGVPEVLRNLQENMRRIFPQTPTRYLGGSTPLVTVLIKKTETGAAQPVERPLREVFRIADEAGITEFHRVTVDDRPHEPTHTVRLDIPIGLIEQIVHRARSMPPEEVQQLLAGAVDFSRMDSSLDLLKVIPVEHRFDFAPVNVYYRSFVKALSLTFARRGYEVTSNRIPSLESLGGPPPTLIAPLLPVPPDDQSITAIGRRAA